MTISRADLGGGQGGHVPKMPNIVQHDTETNAGVHCNEKTPSMTSNYAFYFHLAGLKFQAVYF